MSISKSEFIQTAVQVERDGHKFYTEAAVRASNQMAREMFTSLADDEIQHIQWIKDLAPEVKSVKAANQNLYLRFRNIFAHVSAAELKSAWSSEGDAKAIEFAITMEEKAVLAYEGWAAEADSEEVRKFCLTLAEVEKFHREILENTLKYLENPGDWFMVEEQWNFEGG